MAKCKKLIKSLFKFLNNKVVVIITIFAFMFIGATVSNAQADSNYQFGTAFQYYLLDNRKDEIKEGAETKKATKLMGKLGSGSVAGNFSYDDIVTSAPSGQSGTAKSFCSMLATYSTFGYFSNKIQGFEAIKPMIGRWFVLLILFVPAIVLDLLNLMVNSLITIFTKMNVIPLLANVITNQKFASSLADTLGLDMNQVQTLMQIFITVFLAVFIFGAVLMLKHGSGNLDQKFLHKTKGRLVTIIALPIVVVFSSMLLSDFNQGFTKLDNDTSFAKYLVDDRSWAYNYNFAPDGRTASSSDITPSKRSYVDLSFDPYSPKGVDRIQNINKDSSLIGSSNSSGDWKNVFSNSALLLSYGAGDSFSATDYINYKGTKESEDLFGGGSGQSFGSYYSYAQSMGKKLVDTDNGYTGSGASSDKPSGPFVKAIADYKNADGNLIMSPSTTWRDRYIYGVKDSGSMDAYYNEEPSSEMINNKVGAGSSGNTISDQSMFLLLSSIVNETGGKYSIDAPARGVYKEVQKFDSNRSDYYVVSMVGTPLISIVGLLTMPLITLIILVTIVTAVFSLGIIDMNLRPLSAFFKSYLFGDVEYLEAFLVYSAGIVGTQMTMIVFPSLFNKVIQGVSSLVVKGVPKAVGFTPESPQASLMYNGTTVLISGFIAIFLAFLYIKAPSFREKLLALFSFPWDWAKTTGERFELQANPYSQRISSVNKESARNNPINQALLKSNQAGERWDKALKQVPKNLADEVLPNRNKKENLKSQNDNNNPDVQNSNSNDDGERNDILTPQEIARRGRFDRLNRDMQDIQNSPDSDNATVSDSIRAEDALNKFKAEPTQANLNSAQDKLLALRQRMIDNGAPKEDIAKVDQALNELQNLGDEKKLDTTPIKSANIPEHNTDEAEKPSPWKDGLKPDGKKSGESKDSNKQGDSTNKDNSDSSKDSNKGKDLSDDSKVVSSKNSKKPVNTKTVKTIENETERHVHEHNENKLNENTTNRKTLNQDTKNSTLSNNHKINSTNERTENINQTNVHNLNKRIANTTQIRALSSSLGNSSNDSTVRNALRNIQESRNQNDLNKGVKDLKDSITGLRPSQKRSINKKKMVNTLNNIMKK